MDTETVVRYATNLLNRYTQYIMRGESSVLDTSKAAYDVFNVFCDNDKDKFRDFITELAENDKIPLWITHPDIHTKLLLYHDKIDKDVNSLFNESRMVPFYLSFYEHSGSGSV